MKQRVLVFPVMLSLLLTAACGNIAEFIEQEPGPGDVGRRCTLAACTSGFTLRVPLTVSFQVLRASTVSVCRNTVCYTSSLATLEETHYPETIRAVRISDPSQHDPQNTPLIEFLAERLANGGYRLHFSYEQGSSENLRNGDVYDVTVTDEHGTKLVDEHETISYDAFQPNGPECSPTCWVATIDKT